MPITTLAVPVPTCRPQAAPALLHLQLPVGALGPMPRMKGTFPSLSPTQPQATCLGLLGRCSVMTQGRCRDPRPRPCRLAMKTQGVVPRHCNTSTIVSGTYGAGRQTPTTSSGGRPASSRCAGSRGHSSSRVRYPLCTRGPTTRCADVWRRGRTLQGVLLVSTPAPRAVHGCVAVTRDRDVSGATATMTAAAPNDADGPWHSVRPWPVASCRPCRVDCCLPNLSLAHRVGLAFTFCGPVGLEDLGWPIAFQRKGASF